MTPEQIAKGLTDAQKSFVLEMPGMCWDTYKPFLKCQELGLVTLIAGKSSNYLNWLPLGQQVRAILEQQP